METWVWVVVGIVVVLVVALVLWLVARRRRSERLRDRFGPEYERAVDDAGKRRAAESELEQRERRRDELDIRALQPAARDRYTESWRVTQARFVDAPGEAVKQADLLVMEVMRERGYPVDDFEQRSADISVDHPHLVGNYRSAHAISVANDNGQASTEDLRQAMVHYRSLFEELLD